LLARHSRLARAGLRRAQAAFPRGAGLRVRDPRLPDVDVLRRARGRRRSGGGRRGARRVKSGAGDPVAADLRDSLRRRSYAGLLEPSLFWLDGSGSSPAPAAIVEPLAAAMLDPARFGSRLRALGEKPKLLLRAAVRSSESAVHSTSGAEVGLKGYELDAAAAELVRQGIFFAEPRPGRPVSYRIPRDLAAVARDCLEEESRPLAATFSLRDFATWKKVAPGSRPEPVSDRLARSRERLGDLAETLIHRFGGLLSRTA